MEFGPENVECLYFISSSLHIYFVFRKICEKNEKLNFYRAATSIKRSGPPFCSCNKSFPLLSPLLSGNQALNSLSLALF